MTAPVTTRSAPYVASEDAAQVLGDFGEIRSRGSTRFRLALLGPAFFVAARDPAWLS